MKIRVRNARYSDVMHIELLIQEAIDNAQGQLPPIDRPHIYNYLNFHIPRGEVYLAISDDGKLAGLASMEVATVPWNQSMPVYASSYFIVRPTYQHADTAMALLKDMVAKAATAGSGLVFRATPHVPTFLSEADLTGLGASIETGTAVFALKRQLETPMQALEMQPE